MAEQDVNKEDKQSEDSGECSEKKQTAAESYQKLEGAKRSQLTRQEK